MVGWLFHACRDTAALLLDEFSSDNANFNEFTSRNDQSKFIYVGIA